MMGLLIMNLIAKIQKSKLQFKFLMLLSTTYLASGINMQGLLSMMPFLREEFALTRAQAGLYSTFYFLTATIVAIISGSLVDRFGSKKGMVFGATSIGLLMIIHAAAPNFILILILALLAGIGFSIITPSVNKAIMRNVAPERRAVSMGIMQSGGGIGGFLGASLLPLLGVRIGWRLAILFSGIFAVAIGIFISRYFKEEEDESNRAEAASSSDQKQKFGGKPDLAGQAGAGEQETSLSFKDSFLHLLNNKKLLSICVMGLVFSLASGAIPTHYTLYLTQDLNMSRTLAGLCLGILQIGGIIGRPFWGGFSDKILEGNRSKGLIIIGFTLTALIFIFSFFITRLNPPVLVVFLFSFLLGFVAWGWNGLHLTTVAELATEKFTGMATGLALIFIRTGVVISPPIFGHLADVTSTYFYSWLVSGLFILLFTSIFMVILRRVFSG